MTRFGHSLMSLEDVLAKYHVREVTEDLLRGGAKAGAGHPTRTKPVPKLDVFDVGDEDGNIAPRGWLLGKTFCRRVLSSLIGSGGYGKTTLRLLQALALATGRELTGEHVFARCRVLIVCLEDDLVELRRRVRAAMLHHRIEPADVKGMLYLTTPRSLKVAEYGPSGGPRVQRSGLHFGIVAQINRLKLDLVIIDPAVKAHGLEENDNPAIDEFATFLNEIATEKNVAIDLLAHERKGSGEAGDVNRGRGAGSQKDAARLVYTLTPMSEGEAKTLGVCAEERPFLVRVDSAKVNIAAPSTKAAWFKLVGVALGNGTDVYPHGDTVQTVEPWTPAPLFKGLSDADLNAVLRRLGAGMSDGRRFSVSSAAKDRAAWRVVKDQFPSMEDERCKAIIAEWNRNDLLEVGDYFDPTRREDAKGILSVSLIGAISGDE
jgi:hypothetical protein